MGVAVMRDILVVLWDGVRLSSRSVIFLPSVVCWRACCASFCPSVAFGVVIRGEVSGDCGRELLALDLADGGWLAVVADRDRAGDAEELASSH